MKEFTKSEIFWFRKDLNFLKSVSLSRRKKLIEFKYLLKIKLNCKSPTLVNARITSYLPVLLTLTWWPCFCSVTIFNLFFNTVGAFIEYDIGKKLFYTQF